MGVTGMPAGQAVGSQLGKVGFCCVTSWDGTELPDEEELPDPDPEVEAAEPDAAAPLDPVVDDGGGDTDR